RGPEKRRIIGSRAQLESGPPRWPGSVNRLLTDFDHLLGIRRAHWSGGSDSSLGAMTIERIERRSSARRVARDGATPDAELTPGVRAMVAALNGEVEMLRRDLQVTRDRLELAERAADQDHLLPILNRRAFVRALGWHIAGSARYG